jgi:hypothetical protein
VRNIAALARQILPDATELLAMISMPKGGALRFASVDDNRFSTLAFCHEPLHPIALVAGLFS